MCLSWVCKKGIVASFLVIGFAPGCSDSVTASADVVEARRSLNGTINWGTFDATPTIGDYDCAAAQTAFKAKFTDIFTNILKPRIVTNPSLMLECIKDAVLGGEVLLSSGQHDEVTYPEYIMGRLADNIPSTVICSNAFIGAGYCQAGGIPESFTCGPDMAGVERVFGASVALHELSHRYYEHPGPYAEDYGASVPLALQNCIISVQNGESPAHPGMDRRDSFASTEATLAQVGNEGGADSLLADYCPVDKFINGFYGTTSGALNAVGGICKAFRGTATTDLPKAGAISGTTFRTTCLAGELAIGAWGRSNDLVNSIGSICATEDNIVTGNGFNTSTSRAENGSTTGYQWQRVCPAYQAMKGLRHRSSSAGINRLEIVCQDVRTPQNVDQSLVGTQTGGTYDYSENCQSRSVAMALVLNSVDTGGINRLGGWCDAVSPANSSYPISAIVADGDGVALNADGSTHSASSHILPSHGGVGGGPHVDHCPTGQALVGATIYKNSGYGMAGIVGKCADVLGWSSGTTSATTSTPLRGVTTASSSQLECPPQKFVSGWGISTIRVGTPGNDFVQDLRLNCRGFGGETGPLDQWDTSFVDSSWSAIQNYSTIRFANVDSGGRVDVCGRRSDGIFCEKSNGVSGFTGGAIWESSFSDGNGWNAAPYYSTIRFPDVSGDGLADLCARGISGILCAKSNGSSAFTGNAVWDSTFSDPAWASVQYYSTIRFPNIDGDAARKADVCGRGSAGIVCAISNGSNAFTGSATWNTSFSDANGWASPEYYSTIQFPDVNGDGKADVCGRGRAGVYCAISNGSNAFTGVQLWAAFPDSSGWNQVQYYSTISFPDLNNDGKADVCGRGSAGFYCGLSDGVGSFVGVSLWSSTFSDARGFNLASSYQTLSFPDLNADGKADVCGRAPDGMLCELSTGSSFTVARRYSTDVSDARFWNYAPYYGTLSFADIDGDGKPELCGRSSIGIACER